MLNESLRHRRQCAYMGLEVTDGAHLIGTRPGHPQLRVVEIIDGGPAHDAGVLPDDMIQTLNRVPVRELADFRQQALRTRPGQAVELVVSRDGVAHPITFVIQTQEVDEDEFVPGANRHVERVVIPGADSPRSTP
eukprot:gene520-55608_t